MSIDISLKLFTKEMHKELIANEFKGGWSDECLSDLYASLGNEVSELQVALIDDDEAEIISECADIANFAMMIAENARKR